MKGPCRKALPDRLINETRLLDVQHWKITDGARAREEELKVGEGGQVREDQPEKYELTCFHV